MSKRAAPTADGALIKRARSSEPEGNQQLAISTSNDERQQALMRSVKRTSSLDAPIVSLAGAHSAEILNCRFDPSGQNIAACSADRGISLWRTYPPNTNYGLLSTLHKAPVLDLQWSLFSSLLYTVSADHTLAYTDVTTGQRVRKLRAHRGIINTLDRTLAGGAGVELVATGSDDGTVRIWEAGDEGGKEPVVVFEVGCPVTSVAWSADGANIYAGALDNEIHILDLRKQEQVSTLLGHSDTPTSLSLSPNGAYLLSPSFSSQTIIHDIRPFSPSPNRIHRVLAGAPAGFENTLLKGAWSKEDGGRRVAVGGADRTVTIWDVESGKITYKLPGHKGTVTAVDFHPKEPIILTASKDGTLLLGEIEPSAI
ncbi:WD40 repeat-like protein [Artomyces pyxidatus]|uniref:WD40 repeat-like protein n=1 Tax=Artomyces pyxidatus TaxID=48021 RepID=A0ACB8TJ61_9AGAM|nr:WD40 repeat-like protein [Artomyces pyxidatus]